MVDPLDGNLSRLADVVRRRRLPAADRVAVREAPASTYTLSAPLRIDRGTSVLQASASTTPTAAAQIGRGAGGLFPKLFSWWKR